MNVLLITVDSLRADFLDCYNICRLPKGLESYKKQNLTPNIANFCKESFVFLNAFAAGVNTEHSNPSMLSSTYPLECGGMRRISNERIIISQILQKNGYKCYGFNSNPWLSKYFGYDKGFDYYDDDIKFGGKTTFPAKFLRWLGKPYLSAEGINKKVRSIWEKVEDPFFMWIYYMDAHVPYRIDGIPVISDLLTKYWMMKLRLTENERLKKNLLHAYQTGIKHVDNAFGEIIKILKATDEFDNTLVILTADHGEKFWEHMEFGHKGIAYDEVIHIPLIIKYPHSDHSKITDNMIKSSVCHLDIVPTILEGVGINYNKNMRGRSLLPLMKEPKNDLEEDRAIIIEGWVNNEIDMRLSLRTQKWKYIIDRDNRALYDLNNDPYEQMTVYMKYKKEAAVFEKILQNHAKKYLLHDEKNRLMNIVRELKGRGNL